MKWTMVCSHSYLFLGVVGDGHKRPPVASLQPLWAAAPTLARRWQLQTSGCEHTQKLYAQYRQIGGFKARHYCMLRWEIAAREAGRGKSAVLIIPQPP